MFITDLEPFEGVWGDLGKDQQFGPKITCTKEATQTQYDTNELSVCKLGWVQGLIIILHQLTEHYLSLYNFHNARNTETS